MGLQEGASGVAMLYLLIWFALGGGAAISAEDDPAGDDRPDSTLAEAMIEAIAEYNSNSHKLPLEPHLPSSPLALAPVYVWNRLTVVPL